MLSRGYMHLLITGTYIKLITCCLYGNFYGNQTHHMATSTTKFLTIDMVLPYLHHDMVKCLQCYNHQSW
uniref:Uncharacterized protein n=1 Tax=Rhizophora mucronata TaxID=61149 RepID=A0A2P2NIU5_RHIMU